MFDSVAFRPFHVTDKNALYRLLHNDEVCRYLPGKVAKEETEVNAWLRFFIDSFLDAQGNEVYAVLVDQELVGYAGLTYVKEYDSIEIMYAFHPSVWGNGLASYCALEMKKKAKKRALKKVIAFADLDNIGSQKVLLKIGYKPITTVSLWGLQMQYYELELGE